MRSIVAGPSDPGPAHPGPVDPGARVVLIPGLGAVGYLVDLLNATAGVAPTTLLDLPGLGHRRTAGLPVGLGELSRAAAEALPAGPVVVLGHSTGAQLALRAALLAPQRVAAVVLLGPAFEPRSRPRAALLARALRALTVESPRLLPRTVPYYVRGGRRFVEFVSETRRERPEDLIGQLACPVLVGRGTRDVISSAPWTRQLAAAAPAGRAYTLPGAHNVPFTHPDAVVRLLREAIAAAGLQTPAAVSASSARSRSSAPNAASGTINRSTPRSR